MICSEPMCDDTASYKVNKHNNLYNVDIITYWCKNHGKYSNR